MTYEFPEAEDQDGDARGELINYSYYDLVICYSVRSTSVFRASAVPRLIELASCAP